MVASDVIDFFSKLQVTSYVGVEDFSDKFNFLITVICLMVCTLVVTVKQYILKPISCYISNPDNGHNLDMYVENYCWVAGTIPINRFELIPQNQVEWNAREDNKLYYYQWVPFMLSLQGVLFHTPHIIWKLITNYQLGSDIQHLIIQANQAAHQHETGRVAMVTHIAKLMSNLFFQHREIRIGKKYNFQRKIFKMCNGCFCSKRLGNFIIFGYLFVKICYLSNAAGQVYMMHRFLGFKIISNQTYFGWDIIMNIINGKDWQQTLIFPRVTYCVVPLRNTAGTKYVTAQCVLPGNMLNEKIYIFLWFWITLACVLSFMSVPVWIVRIFIEKNRTNFIRRYLQLTETNNCKKDHIKKFVTCFLRRDGIFLLQMIAINAGDLMASEIVLKLWDIFRSKYFDRDFNDDGIDHSVIIKMKNCKLTLPSAPLVSKREAPLASSQNNFKEQLCNGDDV